MQVQPFNQAANGNQRRYDLLGFTAFCLNRHPGDASDRETVETDAHFGPERGLRASWNIAAVSGGILGWQRAVD
jgi:hypothetical protein